MSVKEQFEAILRKHNVVAYTYEGPDMDIPDVHRSIDLYVYDRDIATKVALEFLPLFNTKGQRPGMPNACEVSYLHFESVFFDHDAKMLGRDY